MGFKLTLMGMCVGAAGVVLDEPILVGTFVGVFTTLLAKSLETRS